MASWALGCSVPRMVISRFRMTICVEWSVWTSTHRNDGAEAIEFYRQHRSAMDEAALVVWPERHHDDELSTLQHAMNLKLSDEAASPDPPSPR
jgi:hypothetical protein